MDDLLPSYESVIAREPWTIIAPYLFSKDLCSAALVCQKWHKIFTPCLWGSPASHFGVQNDTVYVALTRFKRILPYVRLSLRELTHTLHLPPAHAEIYGGPHAEWLRDCLEYLPRLQSLIVDGLPFFDHASLLNLRHSSVQRRAECVNMFPVFSLRLLDAASCINTTSTGLAEALPHFPDLVSLDLSRTPAAKSELVLSKLKYLRNLRVLNLKGLGLKDADFAIIVHSIGTRVSSLDVSNNHLTDDSARLLLQNCIKEPPVAICVSRDALPPVELEASGGGFDDFEIGNLADHLRKKLTTGFVGSLAVEEARDMGIIHLYLASNAMTLEGMSGLLQSGRLHVLDVGTLPVAMNPNLVLPNADAIADLKLPSVSKLTPTFTKYASARLKYLRINYELVTEDYPQDAIQSPRAELSGDLGLYSPSTAHELDASGRAIPERDADDTTIAELPGDTYQLIELPGSPTTSRYGMSIIINGYQGGFIARDTSRPPVIEITPESKAERDAAYAPEAVITATPLKPQMPSPYKTHIDHRLAATDSIDENVCLSPTTAALRRDSDVKSITHAGPRSRHNSIYFTEDRRARLDLRQSQENRLHPGMLPNVHTLVLTDVPTVTTDKEVIRRLIQYIKDAAEETSIAGQRARHTYILPPGRSRAIAEREYARSLFALQRIVLEMASHQVVPKKVSTSWRTYPTKSSTEDADSEAFWEAAAHDFSFFDDEECGLPNLEPGRTLPLAAMSGLELAPQSSPLPSVSNLAETPVDVSLDVVGGIAQFRKERKAAYANLCQMGEVDPEVEGYWPGNITIMRKPAHADLGDLDYYGNRYESGWYYR